MAFTLGQRTLQCVVLTFNAVAYGLININEQVSNVILWGWGGKKCLGVGSQNFSVIGVTKFYGGYDSKKVYGVAKKLGVGLENLFWGSGSKKC